MAAGLRRLLGMLVEVSLGVELQAGLWEAAMFILASPELAVLITRCDHACRERPPRIIFSSHPLGSSRQGEKWYNAVGGYCEKPLQRISHSVMEAGILIWAPLVVFIYIFIYLSGFPGACCC